MRAKFSWNLQFIANVMRKLILFYRAIVAKRPLTSPGEQRSKNVHQQRRHQNAANNRKYHITFGHFLCSEKCFRKEAKDKVVGAGGCSRVAGGLSSRGAFSQRKRQLLKGEVNGKSTPNSYIFLAVRSVYVGR